MKCRGWSPAVNNTCVQLEQDLITLWREVTKIGKGKCVTIANHISTTTKLKSIFDSLNVIKILLYIPYLNAQKARIVITYIFLF